MTSVSEIIEQRNWQVVEAPFNAGKLSHLETIFTIGNGFLGLRGTFEEGYPGEMVSTLAHGIFNHAEGELVPDLVNLPNPLAVKITVNGVEFSMERGKGQMLGYRRVLDLRTACLTREVIWHNGVDAIVKLRFERFASLKNPHLVAQRISVRALLGTPIIRFNSRVDGTQNNEGVHHWEEMQTGGEGDLIFLNRVTTQSRYRIAVASLHQFNPMLKAELTLTAGQPSLAYQTSLAVDSEVALIKWSAIHTNRDSDDPLHAAQMTLKAAQQQGYESSYQAHVEEWATYWHDSDIQIEGDETAQRAVRFCTYHLLIAAPRDDDRVSIGAKTLSGPGYKGHVFWDTELFMVPMLTLTQPKIARNLLMYRYHNLEGARHKAQKSGFAGAMFPWESTDTGEETTPQWTHPLPDGTRIRIWTGDNEQHISTDIAYAVMQYWHWTGDDEFFLKYGAEIVLDTAVFWGSRVEYNADQGRYELTNQIGPDEYHENVNNSVFTNRMTQWHLQTAITVHDWLLREHPTAGAELIERLGINTQQLTRWRDIIARMYLPKDPQTGLLEQFEGFFKLDRIDISHWQPRVANLDAVLGHERTQEVMVIKQADIVMLMALLGDQFGSRAEQEHHWTFYYPLVDHGSSLSPSIHAWIAARLDHMADAYKLFHYAANIDLEDLKGNIRDGIHAAAAGGVWQALVFGFAGLNLDEMGNLRLMPKLPSHWRSVRFRVWCKGQQRQIVIGDETSTNP